MDSYKQTIGALCLIAASASASAAEVVRVNSMNYPAWLVRDYQTMPLQPGIELQGDDLVRTGEGGRVHLQMADGSAVKLGEGARFRIESASMREDQGASFLESTFQVLRGAFRFTSAFFAKTSAGHRVDVNIGAITAGVRGTDIWGRSNLEQDLVCLIDGAITVDTDGEPRVVMEDALSFYVKPKGATPLPVEAVDPEQLQRWANETELDRTNGIASFDGDWQLVLISLSEDANIDKVMAEFREKGFAVKHVSAVSDGRRLHRVVLPGFVSIDAARNARGLAKRQLGITGAWAWKAQ